LTPPSWGARRDRSRTGRVIKSLAAATCALVACAAPASASFSTGLLGSKYSSTDGPARTAEFDWTIEAKAEIARIDVSWRSVAKATPQTPTDPDDPAYDFVGLDAGVRDAAARGLDVVLTVYRAPDFALGPNSHDGLFDGVWRPDVDQFAAFGRALATRYSGSYAGLPRVRLFEVWNEPNLSAFLAPQYEKRRAVAPGHYRRMLNAFGGAVRAVNGGNQVIAGALAPYGDQPGGSRTRPLSFLRDLLCLKKKGGELRRDKCGQEAEFDILSHHPINLSGGPRRSAIDPDDASTPDLKHVKGTLRAAERLNTVAGRHPVWATEIWWETDPPQPNGVSLKRQAKWTAESLYVLWKQGANVVINYIVRDQPPDNVGQTIDSGLVKANGKKKPSFSAFRFPFVVDRKRNRSLLAWGKAPLGGRVKIQRQAGKEWRTVASTRAGENKVFTKKLRGPRVRYRAKVGGEESMAWKPPGR
jgi:hypothetical protein